MVTRTKLLVCKVKDCEFSDEVHEQGAWCRGIPDVEHAPGYTHQHWPKRSQGGRKVVALLCSFCHDRIDNGEWGNKTFVDRYGCTWYLAYDSDQEILIRRHVDSEKCREVERRNGTASESETLEGASSAVTRNSGSDTAPLDEYEIPEELTKAECLWWALRLRNERENNPWATGDLLLASHQHDDPDNSWHISGQSLLDLIGIQPETASNYERVCKAFPRRLRQPLSFGHHQSVYKLPDRDSWLKLAVDEGLSVSELRRRIKPPQPKSKRYTLSELWAALDNGCEPCPGCEPVRFFLRGLEQEQSMTSGLGETG